MILGLRHFYLAISCWMLTRITRLIKSTPSRLSVGATAYRSVCHRNRLRIVIRHLFLLRWAMILVPQLAKRGFWLGKLRRDAIT